MSSIHELQLLNRVLEDGTWEHVESNSLHADHFPLFKEVFTYIEGFKKTHKELPTLETVMNKFEEFHRVEPENVTVVVEALNEDLLHRQFKPILKQTAEKVSQKLTKEAIQELHTQTTKLLKQIPTEGKGYSYIGNADKRKEKYLRVHGTSQDGILGLTTGFKPLDEATNGLICGGDEADYFLVFAPSNMGKTLITSFMSMSAWNSTLENDFPAYFALEQKAEEIARNWDNTLGAVSSLALQRGTLSSEDKDRYIDFLDRLRAKQKDMMIYDVSHNGGRPYTVREIRQILEQNGHNRFTLDQLSKVRLHSGTGNMDLRQRLFDVSAEVREMILDTGKAGYVVAQANRDSAKRVKKSIEDSDIQGEDVGETYAIFQDASKGISIIKVDDNTFKIQVIKNRGNASGQNFLVRYNFETGIVVPLSTEGSERFF